MDYDEENFRIWRRNIAFTVIQVVELILCFCLYCYYSAVYSPAITQKEFSHFYAFIFQGYILSIYLLICNLFVRFHSFPKHLISPLEATLSFWLWFTYLLMTIIIMNQIPMGSLNSKDSQLTSVIIIARKLAICTLITSAIFLLDALFRIDVLVIKRPEFDTTPEASSSRIPLESIASVSVPPPLVLTIFTGKSFYFYDPLNIDFWWLRIPDCLIEKPPKPPVILPLTASAGEIEEGRKSLRKEYLFIEVAGEATSTHNLLNRYAVGKIRRSHVSHNFRGSYLIPSSLLSISSSDPSQRWWDNTMKNDNVSVASTLLIVPSQVLSMQTSGSSSIESPISITLDDVSSNSSVNNMSAEWIKDDGKVDPIEVPAPLIKITPSKSFGNQSENRDLTDQHKVEWEIQVGKIISSIIELATERIQSLNKE